MLDFDKVKAASTDDMASLALCEFSRMVDAFERLAGALERIAPTVEDLQPPAPDATPAAPAKCPCPPELRVKRPGVMGEDVTFECGLCHEPVQQPVGV